MGKKELVALPYLSSWCLVMVERLFLAVPRGCLRFLIVVFPDHTHLILVKKKDGEDKMPNPNGKLSGSVSPRIIDECNQRISEVLCVFPSASASMDSPK